MFLKAQESHCHNVYDVFKLRNLTVVLAILIYIKICLRGVGLVFLVLFFLHVDIEMEILKSF